MAESATVLDLKTKLAGEDYENIPVQRQRLIYSGRVMKNDDTLATYKIKPNNTIHMVKSAASNPGQPAATSAPATAPAVPTNMAAGTANNPLAGLTGARYAGHQVNLPGMDMFGPDGGVSEANSQLPTLSVAAPHVLTNCFQMGPPLDEENMQRMLSDPNVQQTMNEALNNPDFVNMMIESNPMLRNMPNAREIITSPFMRQMMSNPQLLGQAMRAQRGMGGGGAAFPAPGATDTTPGNAASGDASAGANPAGGANAAAANPFMNPFMSGMMDGNGAPNFAQMMQALQGAGNPFAPPAAATANQPRAAATGETPATTTGDSTTTPNAQAGAGAAANPFAALFPQGQGGGGAAGQANPFGVTPEMMQQMMTMFGGGGAAANTPPDNRPPEERYADQLRQLNDMGFFDFDRNVAALRRSGGSVQGAIEYLLSATD